ncbi:hypothetical protein ACQKFL_16795 [Vreelandella titanicae]|uniref:hypothetical protein n=1 Tax=Vreelandella titanicae TaxID=664683 RepID=UPI003D088F88|tara:strand:+ start:1970 stop:3373 length:1404 start_codon:yes stop_codon:yes gene_type:complete
MKKVPLSWLTESHSIAEKLNAFQSGISRVPVRQRGAGSVEYMLITGVMVAALLTPFSTGQNADSASVLQRLMDAISGQQKAYNYSTQYPSTLNIQDIADSLGDLSPGSGQNGGAGNDNANSGDAPGSGNGGGESQGNDADGNGDSSAGGENDADAGQGEPSGEEDNADQNGNGEGDATDGDGSEGGSGSGSSAGDIIDDIDISWEGLAATALAICLASPDQNPIWTQDDLDAYEASANAYDPGFIPDDTWYDRASDSTDLSGFELNKKNFTDNGIEYPYDTEDDSKGFSATLSQTEDGRWILAFRGSEWTKDDWLIANPGQAFFGKSHQYDAAVELAILVKEALGDDVLLAGHSQGGGQAQAAAYATGLDAITFNAAGIRGSYKMAEDEEGNKVSGKPGNLRNHYIVGELLTTLQTVPDVLIPSANGTQIAHSAPCDKELGRRHMLGMFDPPACPGRERREESCPGE